MRTISAIIGFFSMIIVPLAPLAKPPLNARDVEMIQVQGAEAPMKIELYGQIHSAKESDLHFPITGTIDKVHVIDGQTVVKNEPLVSLATQAKTVSIQDAQQQIKISQQELDKLKGLQKKLDMQQLKDKHALYLAKKNLDKQKSLRQQKIIGSLQLEEATYRMDEKKALLLQTEYKVALNIDQIALAQAHIEVLKTTQEMAEQWIKKSTLKAPFSGKVRKSYIKIGQEINRNDAILQLSDSKNMLIRAVLSHSEVTQLKQLLKRNGLSTVKIALADQEFSARVLSILPDSRDHVTGVDMMVLTHHSNDAMLGTKAKFTMLIPTDKKRYEVPQKAVINQRYVYKLNADNRVIQVPVEVIQSAMQKQEQVLIETDQLGPIDTLLIAKNRSVQSGEQVAMS